MRYVLTMAAVSMAATVSVHGQEPKAIAERHAAEAGVQNRRVSVESRLTRSAPYSAEAVTESVQSLADGNRIVTRNATRIFRDGEGRMRREQLNAAGTDVVNINISDPVSGTTFMLDPASHMAYRNGFIFTTATDTGVAGSVASAGANVFLFNRTVDGGVAVAGHEPEQKMIAEGQALKEAKMVDEIKMRVGPAGGHEAAGLVMTGAFPARIAEAVGQTTKEDLGQQTIEGIAANGTRSTTEIAAGAIGNDQPIKIVSEQWFSPELQVLVLTKHTDPRVGETVYRLTGIIRAEPARSLFDLPADYTLKESKIRRQEP